MDSYEDDQQQQQDEVYQQQPPHQEEEESNNYETGFVSPPTGEDIRSVDNHEDYPTLPPSQPQKVQASADSDEPAFIFSVSEPEKKSTGKTFDLSYWVYKITIDTKLDQYKQSTLICHRRYNDFVWFRELLVSSYSGIIIPPLPEKSILASVEKIFSSVDTNSLLEYRQRALTKFLTRVGEHPVLQTASELQQFLEASEDEFNQMKNVKTKAKSGGSFSLFKSKGATPEPEWITSHKKFIEKLDSSLKELRQRLQVMITKRKEMATGFMEYGKSFAQVGTIEKEYDQSNSLAKNLLSVGQSAEQISKVTDDQAQKETMQVIETLTYYLGMCDSIRHTASQVEEARSEKDSAQSHLVSLQAQKEKPNLKEDKRQQLETQIEEGQQRVVQKTERLESSEQSFKSDLERFDLERKIDFSCMLQSFLNLQIEYNQKLHEQWSQLIPQVNASIYEE